MNRRWQRFLALYLTVLLVVTQLQPAMAGFLGLPVNLPNIPGVNLQGEAEKQLYKGLGKALGEQAPLYLDQKAAFPKVKVERFNPTVLHIKTVKDLVQPLQAGDYSIADILTFCSQNSIHRSGGGLGYKLAPIEGKQADAIATLLFRGMLLKTPPQTLQAMSWRIQGGLPLSQWNPDERALIHKMMPEFEGKLQGDLLAQYQSIYTGFVNKIPGHPLPGFDQVLDKLGPIGAAIKLTQRQRSILANNAIEDDKLPDLLYQAGNDPSPRVAPAQYGENSQWNEIRKGVYARLVITGGNLRENRMDLRILPEALHSWIPAEGVKVASREDVAFFPVAIAAAEVIGAIVDIGGAATAAATEEEIIAALLQRQARGLIGYSLQQAAQALAPMLPMLMNDESGGSRNRNSPSVNRSFKKTRSGQSGKEAARDVPSWARGERPYVDESGEQFATRLLDNKYGRGNYGKGPNTEYSKIKKWGERAFENP